MELKCTLFVFGFFLSFSDSAGCDIGFKLTKKGCKDENECETPNLCGENAQCVNTFGSYYCTCDKGFRSFTPNFTATDGLCVDINECIEKTHTCSTDRVCENTIGSYNCNCSKGYHGQGLNSSCEDVDECVSSVCGVHSSCINTPGGFSCICSPGFDTHENNTCTDIDECKDPDVCGTNAVCRNHPGSFICECQPGYSNYCNNQSKCIDISQMHFCV